ncbi:exodeoxyribonuclease III [Sodalis endosymbiont of Henestaris halophilus]|uniref:exodeoxyribonuclease III n=1 Tax=Sodalis endosymbiont of Henestaris halophilus TaxID=1929246 RepID=UPI000BBF9E30|nr:exodeoxyribonuclease III [Sodalis endosymbiont of Henestaris halophilus]SNC58743.1 Exodeoxyribonuclease III [Sodalis endosymbiont of Henestaris halophilus]
MKVVSFNINGLRAHPHQLAAIITTIKPDVIGLQETKVHDDMFPIDEVSRHGYYAYYHGQKGHYGVALLSRKKPLAIRRGFNTDGYNAQRRIIMADFITTKGLLTVVNGYFPRGENRDHKVKFLAKERFYRDLQDYVKKNHYDESLLLVMGDMNISPTDLDIGIGEKSRKRWLRTGKCSFLPEELVWMEHLLACGLVDIYRQNNPSGNNRYSWFDYRSRSFAENRGLRIDLLLASLSLAAVVRATDIDYSIRAMDKPSDHAPVWADFDL